MRVPRATGPRLPQWWVGVLAVVLAFGFLGSRGIWDPDEGRYTNVALNMLDSGDWLNPMRNDDVGHWTKPPLTYWAIAASIAAFGQHPWSARFPLALSYLACTWIAWRCARRLAPGSQSMAAVAYTTMLVPFAAAGVLTTDFILAATQGMAVLGFVEARFGTPAHAQRWRWLMWVAFAAAFMTKGPPGLLPLPAIIAMDWLVPPRQRRRRLAGVAGVVLFLALALPWYAAVTLQHDGLLRYFLGAELVDRVASDRFHRNGEWLGWLKIYGPTLVLGSLPWTPVLWRWCRGLASRVRAWATAASRRASAPELFLVLWIAVPLLVFCLSSSRLPLYVLPLFVPLAVLVALQRQRESRPLADWRWVGAWALLLLGLRLAAAGLPTHKDASAWADAIRERSAAKPTEVIFVDDMARYGLHLHLDVEVEKVSLQPVGTSSAFNPTYDEDLARELEEAIDEPGAIYVVKADHWPAVRHRIEALGYVVAVLGTPFEGRVLFEVRAASPLRRRA